MSAIEEMIRKRAYELWEQAGCPEGRSYEFWFAARAEIEGAKRPQERAESAVSPPADRVEKQTSAPAAKTREKASPKAPPPAKPKARRP
jgi:hypothetical protein